VNTAENVMARALLPVVINSPALTERFEDQTCLQASAKNDDEKYKIHPPPGGFDPRHSSVSNGVSGRP